MSLVADIAVCPTAIGPGGTHPTLVLWQNGVITPVNGAKLPQNAPGDTVNGVVVPWGSSRFNGYTTSSSNRGDGEIGQQIWVDPASWTSLTEGLDDLHGYVLDGWGRMHTFGSSFADPETGSGLSTNHYSPGWNIYRAFAVNPTTRTEYYVLDGWGGIHCGGSLIAGDFPSGNPYWNGIDIARDLALTWAGGNVFGVVLDGEGGLHPATRNLAYVHPTQGWWITLTFFGGGATPGQDVFRACPFDFTAFEGYELQGDGQVWKYGLDPLLGGANTQPVNGGPRWPGAFVAYDLEWPDHSKRFFILGDAQGGVHEFKSFVTPLLSIVTPGATLTNTSRPTFSGVYGPGQAADPPAPLAKLQIYLRHASDGVLANPVTPGAVFSHIDPGIVGITQGGTWGVGPMADDLLDNHDYRLYVKGTSQDPATAGWGSIAVHTAFSRPAAPGLNAVMQPDNADGPRVVLTATGGGTYKYQFSDDYGSASPHWYDVANGTETTASPIYDYEVLPNRNRKYRAYRLTVTPYLSSLVSGSQPVVPMTGPTAVPGGGYAVVSRGASPVVVPIVAAAFRTQSVQPLSKHAVGTRDRQIVLSGGYKGEEGDVELYTKDHATKDALEALLHDPQIFFLRTPMARGWYFWPGDGISSEFVLAAALATGPDAVFPVRDCWKTTMPWIEVSPVVLS